jgi:hypothetical protein
LRNWSAVSLPGTAFFRWSQSLTGTTGYATGLLFGFCAERTVDFF